MQKYDPFAFEELKGIAKGAETPLDIIILINARYDLTKYKNNSECADQIADNSKTADECSTGAIIDERAVKLVQNWDLDSYVYDHDLCVVLETHTTSEERTKGYTYSWRGRSTWSFWYEFRRFGSMCQRFEL